MMIWQLISESYAFLKGFLKNREGIFWLVVFPIVFLVIMVMVFASEGGVSYDVGIVGNSSIISEIFSNISYINSYYVKSEEMLYDMVRNGSLDAGLILNLDEEVGISGEVKIVYISNLTSSETAARMVSSIIGALEDEVRRQAYDFAESYVPRQFHGFLKLISDPIEVQYEGITPEIYGTPGGLKLFYVISMIGVQVLFIGMFNGVLNILEKKRSGVLKVVVSSPIDGYVILMADTLGAIVATLISGVAILVAGFFIGADYTALTLDKILLILSLTIVSLLFMTGLGLILSTLPKTYEGAQALANMVAFPLMFVGGIVVPEFLLPDYIRTFAEFFPVSRLISTMRDILIFNIPMSSVYFDILYGLSATLIVFIIGAYVYRRLLLKTIEHPI